jgi:UDP-N-acetyl-D-mannosaminuronic acid dehydrogenase
MELEFQKVVMVGLGYIGLPTAAVMASRGLEVIGIDVNEHTVNTINQGNVHIVEPDLDIVVRSVVTTGNLKATTDMVAADAFLIAVPTPFKDGHKPDLSFIESAASAIAEVLEPGNLVILESTCPVGATEKLSCWLSEKRPDLTFPHQVGEKSDIRVAHCPERVLPGHVLRELVNNDRIIGGMSNKCSIAAASLYKIFVKGDCISTTARTAELSKLTENAFRDVNIAFANEISLICDALDVNVWDLISLANRHPRVNILQPGPGVGGHCIAVDPWFIVDSVPDKALLIKQAREVNDSKPEHVLTSILAKVDKFKKPTIACFGLSFKADIDDLRASPAMGIVNKLVELNVADILIVEPNISELPSLFANMENVRKADLADALGAADIVVGLVDHKEFREINAEKLQDKIVIDTRGMWR